MSGLPLPDADADGRRQGRVRPDAAARNRPGAAGSRWQRLGLLLRRARQAKGLSLMAFAAQLDVEYQSIHKYEHGISKPPADRLFVMADLLGLGDAKLRAALLSPAAALPAEPTPADRARDRIAATIARLDEPELLVVQATASALEINRHRRAREG